MLPPDIGSWGVFHSAMYYTDFNMQTVIYLDLDRDVATIGSQHTTFVMSGCEITSLPIPSEIEGITEVAIEVRPQDVTATEYTNKAFNPF